MKLLKLLAAAALCSAATLALMACAAPTVDDYVGQTPTLDLAQYFNGTVNAHGMFTDRSGKVVKRFTVTMNCRWQGDEGMLDEAFIYSDGQRERRVWRLTKLGNGRYSGVADDVVGTASGQTAGNAFNWRYTLKLPVEGRLVEVQFDDWMYLMDERVMLNKAVMSKFGLRLGEVTLAFFKP